MTWNKIDNKSAGTALYDTLAGDLPPSPDAKGVNI